MRVVLLSLSHIPPVDSDPEQVLLGGLKLKERLLLIDDDLVGPYGASLVSDPEKSFRGKIVELALQWRRCLRDRAVPLEFLAELKTHLCRFRDPDGVELDRLIYDILELVAQKLEVVPDKSHRQSDEDLTELRQTHKEYPVVRLAPANSLLAFIRAPEEAPLVVRPLPLEVPPGISDFQDFFPADLVGSNYRIRVSRDYAGRIIRGLEKAAEPLFRPGAYYHDASLLVPLSEFLPECVFGLELGHFEVRAAGPENFAERVDGVHTLGVRVASEVFHPGFLEEHDPELFADGAREDRLEFIGVAGEIVINYDLSFDSVQVHLNAVDPEDVHGHILEESADAVRVLREPGKDTQEIADSKASLLDVVRVDVLFVELDLGVV